MKVKSIFGFNSLSSEGRPWLIGRDWAINDTQDGLFDVYRVSLDGSEKKSKMKPSEAKRFLYSHSEIPTVEQQIEYNDNQRMIVPEQT